MSERAILRTTAESSRLRCAQAVPGAPHRGAGLPRITLAAALTISLLLGACGPSTPKPDSPTDSVTVATPVDTYFEGSRRVWEAARDRGVTFRAVGQEPGWVLEIEGSSRITLVTNYGADSIITPVPEPVSEPATGSIRYHATTTTHDLRVSIRDQPCSDTMSGERFSLTVDIALNGTAYHGCGRMLDRLPN